jgi:hypothetical protein
MFLVKQHLVTHVLKEIIYYNLYHGESDRMCGQQIVGGFNQHILITWHTTL